MVSIVFKDLNDKAFLELYINNNKLGDEGCIILWNEFIGKCNTILKVEMKSCSIGDDGIKAILDNLKENSQIKEINLEDNKFNQELINDMKNEKIKIII